MKRRSRIRVAVRPAPAQSWLIRAAPFAFAAAAIWLMLG
jgi:hypothetical protein